MRVRGRVVGAVVVLEEPMPEGSEVEVLTHDEPPGVFVDEADEDTLAQAMAETGAGAGVTVDEVLARLKSVKRSA